MALRASAIVNICFGPAPVRAKLYTVAAARTVPLSQVHATCGGKLEQQYYCPADGAVVPRPAIAKQYRLPDGTVTTLTEDDLRTAESERVGTLEVFEFVPHGSVDPIYLGKAMLLGPDDGHDDGYSSIVDALAETGAAAIGVLYARTRDQNVLIQRYRARGLLLHELFQAGELRAIDEVKLPERRDHPVSATPRLWISAVERLRKAKFDARAYEDGYPGRVLRAAQRKGAGVPPLLRVGRERAMNGPLKPPRSEHEEPASVHRLPVAAERREESPSEKIKTRG